MKGNGGKMKNIRVKKKNFNTIETFRNRCGCWCTCSCQGDEKLTVKTAELADNRTYNIADDKGISPNSI